MENRSVYSDTFIVRIWREIAAPNAETPWRGHVEHVRTGERRGFQDMATLTRFIQQWSNDGYFEVKSCMEGGDVSQRTNNIGNSVKQREV